MTWFTKETPTAVRPQFGLSQRGRAGLEILGAMQRFASTRLRGQAKADFYEREDAREINARNTPDAGREVIKENLVQGRRIAEAVPVYRLERFCQAYTAMQIFARAIPAIEERREQFEGYLQFDEAGAGGSLELDETITPPKYFEIEWHLEPDGWDGYDLYGPVFAFALGPLVFRHGGYAAVNVDDDLRQNRIDILKALPRDDYARIYEPGCGGGTTLSAAAERWPDAEIVGCDLSPLLLRMGHLMSARRGQKIHYKQRDVTDTGEPNESVDAVVTYALHHEIPPKENLKLFAEMYRVMKPGADFVLSDPPPFREVDLFQALILDWETENRGEPFFTVSGLADWDQALRDAGFVNVKSYAAGPNGFPWVISGSKPVAHPAAMAA